MRWMIAWLFCIHFVWADSSSQVLYSSIDPKSLAENLAFYELYPTSKEGKKALQRAWSLLHQKTQEPFSFALNLLPIESIISWVNHQNTQKQVFDEKTVSLIERLTSQLLNRKLSGHQIQNTQEIFSLAPEQIDLARSLFLAQLDGEPNKEEITRFYEASIDLMALQIAARLTAESTPQEKIRAINHFIFHEMEFRFPPESLWAKEIDTYTFLSSVIDKRQGVCLGVSILYLSLAQRLGLSLEAVIPPGHIFVRYVDEKGEVINIETTARGIDVPTEHYLGIELKELPTCNLLEVIGLAFINQASVHWSKKEYNKALVLYEKAQPFLQDDPLLMELLGYSYLFVGKRRQGEKLLKQVLKTRKQKFHEGIIEDYFAKNTDIAGIQAIFLPVDEKRDSILEKREELAAIVKKYPKFRAGLLQLSNTWLQLGREKEALKILKQYYALDASNPKVNYYLSAICLMRSDYNLSWYYLKKAQKELSKENHSAKVLIELQKNLEKVCPEPS